MCKLIASSIMTLCLGTALQLTADDLFPVSSNGRWGYIDSNGILIIDYKYDFALFFSEGCAFVKNGEKGFFINERDKILFELKDELNDCYADPFSCGLSRVEKTIGGKQFYVDRQGNCLKLNCSVQSISNFSEGLASVEVGGKWGYINTAGSLVISNQYDHVYPFIDGSARVSTNRIYSLIDKNGVQIRNPKYETLFTSYPPTGISIALLCQGYQTVTNCNGNAGEGNLKKKWLRTYIVVDQAGQRVGHLKFEQVSLFQEGKVAVCFNRKWGFLDASGKICVDIKYDEVKNFTPESGGIVAVQVGGKWGFIDEQGKVIIEPQFNKAENFRNGLAKVVADGDNDWGYINKTGTYVWRSTKKK